MKMKLKIYNILEYGMESSYTIYRLQEYGKEITPKTCLLYSMNISLD